MGRRSRSPRSSRRHSSSNSPSRRRDRSHNRHNDQSRKESNLKGIENAKKRMREALESAKISSTSSMSPGCASRPSDDMSSAEQASRAREIERIDEGGFHQAQYNSTAGGAGGRIQTQKKNISKAERVEFAQEEHEKAIFGPAWMDKTIQKGQTTSGEKSGASNGGTAPPMSVGPSRLHAKFLEDPEKRKSEWFNMWQEERRSLGVR